MQRAPPGSTGSCWMCGSATGSTVQPCFTVQYDQASFADPGGRRAGSNLRRFQVGGFLGYGNEAKLGFIYDFGYSVGGSQRVLEGSLAYTGFRPFQVKLGITQPKFFMKGVEDGTDTVFLERASIVDVTRNIAASSGRLTAQVQESGPRWLAAAALTGGIDDGRQRAVVGRVAGLPVQRMGSR